MKGDYYYSALDGDFDYNRDGIPGNSANDDPYPELAIGRIEVRNQSEASAVLDKLIKAEKFEYPLRTFRVLLAGGDITRNDNAGRTLKEHVRNILSFAAPYTFTGLYPSGGDMLLNSTNFISELSQGYYLVNHIDHSTDMSLGAGVINSGSSVHYYELLSLSGAPFLFVSMGCNTASHIPQSPMNTLIKLSNSGAFAYIGFSTPSYSTETSADTIIFRALVVEKKTLGDALNKAKLAFSFDQYIKSALTLSGDPSMTIFPPTPETLSLVFPTNIQAGTQTITIRTNSERARIILYQRNNLYKIIESTSDGSATTTVSLIADTLYISATKYGYIPVCRKLPVLQSSLSNLKVVSYEITDFFGDQNGIASPGESLSLFLRVQNTGLSALNMTQILIRTNSPHIHPIDTSIIISNLQPMAQADAQVRIYIPPNNINSYERIRIISSDSSLDERINFYIQSPIIYISSMRRNPPTYPSYGDTITLTIKLKNIGPGNLISPRIVLTPVDSAIEPLDSTFTTPILSQ
ncbi:MAG: C25 family cysteine peptidase, partial [bacterium]